ncbi:MAG: flagellar protein FliT [Betaproteobacteria bacterium]|nr:flagellar protein FliT [Betaproteobacteria bacterium]
MSNSATLLATYEAISELSAQMLDAARHADWARLTLLEKDCRWLIEHLRTAESPAAGDVSFRERKLQIIRKVLAEDAEIRDLVEPWMAELEALIGSGERARKLRLVYGARRR